MRLKFVYAAMAIGALLFGVLLSAPAWPHSWYSGQRNDTTGVGCCGGSDCFEVPLEWLSQDADNYIVTVPNPIPNMTGFSGVFHPGPYAFPISEAQPTPHIDTDDGKEHSGYHACIWGGKPRCFFFPSGS